MRSTVFVSVSPWRRGDVAEACAEQVARRRLGRRHDARRRHVDGAAQAAGPGLQQAPAVAHPGAQRTLDAAVHPPGVAGEHDPGVAAQLRALAAGERDVGRDVVAQPGTVDGGEQRADVVGDALGQHAARVGPRACARAGRPRACPASRRRRRRPRCGPATSSPGSTTSTRSSRTDCTAKGTCTARLRRADLEEVHAGLAARRLQDDARARAGPVRARVALAHAAHAPTCSAARRRRRGTRRRPSPRPAPWAGRRRAT